MIQKISIWVSLILCTISMATAQTQVPNSGFENWPGEATSSPPGWHSYDEAAGVFAGVTSNKSGNPPVLERVAGHTGKYACVIRCNKIMGVSANGALTCGRVYMGAMGASSSKNYCYTDRKGGYALKFTGRPDSVYVWAKFKMQGEVYATAKVHLHTDCDFRDFVDIGQSSDIASAIMYFKDRGNGGWHLYKQAFKAYASPQKATAESAPLPTLNNWTRRPSYMLFSFSTNRYVMKGSKGDALYIDDIRLIYNKNLSAIVVDSVKMGGFCPTQMAYEYCLSPETWNGVYPTVVAETESPRAYAVVEQATVEHPEATIVVYHDDVYSGEAEPKTYTVRFNFYQEGDVVDR